MKEIYSPGFRPLMKASHDHLERSFSIARDLPQWREGTERPDLGSRDAALRRARDAAMSRVSTDRAIRSGQA
jgi:hypothetical protein